jgi:hypothetical protein
VLLATAFVGIRVTYGLIAESTQKRNLNPVTGSLAIRTVLGLLPELITTVILMFVGFRTRHIGGYNRRMVQTGDTNGGMLDWIGGIVTRRGRATRSVM